MTHELAEALADRYLLEEEIGRGASATVYLAQDLRHGRRVAVKVLHSALGQALGVERFQREIRTQARLHHPHILPVFDSGIAAGHLYYVMPHVETGTLKDRLQRHGPLSVSAAVQVGQDVASALSYAHALGVVHRDLKPENIVFSPMGHAILADFGIAVALDGPHSGRRLTETGVAVGTPVYMSPEQSAGDEVLDGRSDQYSLAAVIYEALAGIPPFTGPNARAIFAQKLTEMPPPIGARRSDVPAALERVLFRALERGREARYDSIDEFAAALADAAIAPAASPPAGAPGQRAAGRRTWRPAALVCAILAVAGIGVFGARRVLAPKPAAPAGPRVVAVLPFKNLGAPGDQYFADGLTEEITGRLAGLSGLRVISRTSADQYRASPQSVRTIGAELGADYVLEGSVRWAKGGSGPGRLRVTPQLIAVRDDSHLWAGTYEAELGEVFRLQAEIAAQVTAALDVALRAPEREALAAVGTKSAEAYDFYLRGMDYMDRTFQEDDFRNAVRLFEQAVAADSSFAQAYARLSRLHAQLYWHFYDRTEARLQLAKRAADRAKALSPDLPETHTALGYYYYWGRLDYDRALREFELARRQQPSNSELLAAVGYIERRRNRWQESLAHLVEALRYDPRSGRRNFDVANNYLSLHMFPEADHYFDRAILLSPDWSNPYVYKAWMWVSWRGDLAGARAILRRGMERVEAGRFSVTLAAGDRVSVSLVTADTSFNPWLNDLSLANFGGDSARYHVLKAEAGHLQGHTAAAHGHADSALALLEPRARSRPDDAKLLELLARSYSFAGRHAEAVRVAARAVQALPIERDAVSGPYIQSNLARVYMDAGQPERAITILERLLDVPGWITPVELRADPLWEPLRRHPRFRALLTPRGDPS